VAAPSADPSSWWAGEPQSEFYQGDIIRDLPFWTITPELKFLQKRTIATKEEGPLDVLFESESPHLDRNEFFHFLGRGRYAPGIMLTHDCEFDNKRDKSVRAQIARLGDIDDLNPEEKTKVVNQRSYSKLVLPSVPTLGKTLYVDFRIQITLDTRLLAKKPKIASLSDYGRGRLRVGLIYYYLRKEPPPDFTA
jgi:hypothetical protein